MTEGFCWLCIIGRVVFDMACDWWQCDWCGEAWTVEAAYRMGTPMAFPWEAR